MLKKGDFIGRYEIISELGGGGAGTVYRAYDPNFELEVAVKVMAYHLSHDPLFHERFLREAQVMRSLEHPAILPVYDFDGEHEPPYLVMRLMPGQSLNDHLKKGAFSLQRVVWILERLAPALDMAHERGVVHRDLKPHNILFDGQGNPCIADFGIAKMLVYTALTRDGQIIGTLAYMSPQQINGEQVDKRSDIYSLGVILFELLSGERPYDSDTQATIIYKHMQAPIPNILAINPELPPTCQDVINKAMAKQPEDRYQTASEMCQALRKILDQSSQESQTKPSVISAQPTPSNAWITMLALSFGLLLLNNLLALWLAKWGELLPFMQALTALLLLASVVLGVLSFFTLFRRK